MKKMIPLLAVLGGAAAYAAYKMKKDEEKKIIDLDEGMMYDETQEDESVEEGPINDPTSNASDAKEAMKDILEDADRFVKNTTEKVSDLASQTKEQIEKGMKDVKENLPDLVEDEINELKQKSKDLMDKMKAAGDVLEHERPVEHTVRFENEQDAQAFKDALINRGYVISATENEYELVVLHISPLDEVKLIKNILYIVNEARRHHGTYEGWTSKIAS